MATENQLGEERNTVIDKNCFALNRIVSPSLGLRDFYELTASVGLKKVELRNDLGGKDPIDGMKSGEATRQAADLGLEVVTINALQKFNLASNRPKALEELKVLLDLAKSIGCRAIVLCPNNDGADARSQAQRVSETVDALAAFGPLFEAAGLLGYVEPLGFAISSLSSLVVAEEAIVKSGRGCYRVVHDTFHHYIGPDERSVLGRAYRVETTGLVHISGVEAGIAKGEYRDEHRVLVGPADRMKSKEQIRDLDGLGYAGDYSFEPFSPAIQKLGKSELTVALRKSLEYILA
jgi:2-keto-myo-inositol isomerase